jgi:periodic tryptophan protein 1
VRRAFAGKVTPTEDDIKERLVGVQNDSSDEESDDEGGADVANGNGEGGWESMDED